MTFSSFYIKRGRLAINKTARKDRNCTLCKCVEDEFHALNMCPMFKNERVGSLSGAVQYRPNIHNFYTFLRTENINEQERLAIFLFKNLIKYKNIV